MLHHIRHISSVAFATMASRILGLVRDIMLFAVLGVGGLNSAFIFGFTLPNLFRRLLGEGALTSATVPMFSEALEIEGRPVAFDLLNQVMSRLLVVLVLLTAVGIAALATLHQIPGLPGRWYDGADFSIFLLPYMILICQAALVSASLNTLGRFLWPAMSAVWLNLTMIAALSIPFFIEFQEPVTKVWLLCGGVMLGGVVQLGVPVVLLLKEGWQPRLDWRQSERLGQLQKLFLPGLAAAAIFQINILVSRTLAFSLDDDAAGVLYLANRLIELPLGVFAIAVTTVLFPALAKLAAKKDLLSFTRDYDNGIHLVMVITVPAGLGLMILGPSILTALFQWGLFDQSDVQQVSFPLAIFSLAVPFYAWATLITRGFHALRDMRTPVRLAAVNFVLNLILSLALMKVLGTVGLAFANLIVTVVHCLLLHNLLPLAQYRSGKSYRQRWMPLVKVCFAGFVMVAAIQLGQFALSGIAKDHLKAQAILTILVMIPLGIAVYAGVLAWLEPVMAQKIPALLNRKRRDL